MSESQHLSQSVAGVETVWHVVETPVDITIQAGSDAVERVTGPNGDEWRAQMYDISTREEVLAHWAYNAVENGVRDASQLDGWADLEPGEVTMEVKR